MSSLNLLVKPGSLVKINASVPKSSLAHEWKRALLADQYVVWSSPYAWAKNVDLMITSNVVCKLGVLNTLLVLSVVGFNFDVEDRNRGKYYCCCLTDDAQIVFVKEEHLITLC